MFLILLMVGTLLSAPVPAGADAEWIGKYEQCRRQVGTWLKGQQWDKLAQHMDHVFAYAERDMEGWGCPDFAQCLESRTEPQCRLHIDCRTHAVAQIRRNKAYQKAMLQLTSPNWRKKCRLFRGDEPSVGYGCHGIDGKGTLNLLLRIKQDQQCTWDAYFKGD